MDEGLADIALKVFSQLQLTSLTVRTARSLLGERGVPAESYSGEWLRSQAQAAVRGGGAGGVGSGVGAAGIPEGVPKEDEDDGV